MWEVNHAFSEEILKILWKSLMIRKKSRKIRKPDKYPERKIIISYMRSKPSILSRFEKLSAPSKKKEIFKLQSFAHEVKSTVEGKFDSLHLSGWQTIQVPQLLYRSLQFKTSKVSHTYAKIDRCPRRLWKTRAEYPRWQFYSGYGK